MHTFRLTQLLLLLLAGLALCTACDDDETYADQKKRERKAINSFLAKGACVTAEDSGDTLLYVTPIKVITEEQFAAQDSTTDIASNEYVLLSSSGIYMQIVRKGVGEKLQHDETAKVLCRYTEFNIMGDSIQTINDNLYYIAVPDEMRVTNSYGVFTGSFISGVMRNHYGTASVPEGWLVPFKYIHLGRRQSDTDEIAKVRLIVPHSSGNSDATTKVYPCFYEIKYQRGR